jgi:hypothetical protein
MALSPRMNIFLLLCTIVGIVLTVFGSIGGVEAAEEPTVAVYQSVIAPVAYPECNC